MSPEIQAAIDELEAQRNALGTRALRHAVEKAQMQDEIVKLRAERDALRADILARDNAQPEF